VRKLSYGTSSEIVQAIDASKTPPIGCSLRQQWKETDFIIYNKLSTSERNLLGLRKNIDIVLSVLYFADFFHKFKLTFEDRLIVSVLVLNLYGLLEHHIDGPKFCTTFDHAVYVAFDNKYLRAIAI